MNNKEIITTALKIFGLYFLTLTVINLRDLLFLSTDLVRSYQDNQENWIVIGGQIYSGLFNLIVGLLLITKSDWLTENLKLQKTADLRLNLEKSDWIELTIIVISLLTIIYSIPEFLYKIVNYVYFNDYEKAERHLFWTGRNKADVFYSVFKFIVGLLILLNARAISKRLTRIGDKDEKLME
jgi:hypothetical protein